jgi:hypothetical protein
MKRGVGSAVGALVCLALLGGAGGAGVTVNTARSGAYGYVTAGPTCPVHRLDQPCPPRPVRARVEGRDAAGQTIASTTTDEDGGYRIRLAPGRYTLVATPDTTSPRCPPTDARVGSPPSRVDIGCDTGLR